MKIAYLVAGVLMLCACSAINVKRGAELVRVTNREPGRECKFLGDVTTLCNPLTLITSLTYFSPARTT